MNIFQVLNHQSTLKQNELGKKIGLMGVKENIKIAKMHSSSVRVARPSIICSDNGLGIQVQQSDNEYYLTLFRKTYNPTLNVHKKYIISTSNRVKKNFDVLMVLLTVYSVLSSLYFLAFHQISLTAFIADQIIWGLFIIDFVLNFFSQFHDSKKRKISNLRLVAEKYSKTMMIPDLFSIIPLRFAGHPNGEFILRLLRTLKISRVFSLVNIYSVADFVSNFFYKEESLEKKRLKIRIFLGWEIIKQMIKMFFVTYFLACIWYYYIDYVLREKNEPNDFIKNFGLEYDDSYDRFIKTWYFIFTTLVTVGYGDFYATNKYEMGFAIILLLAGPTWFAFMMGTAINVINSLQDLGETSHSKSELQLWLSFIESNTEPLPTKLKEKILSHFVFMWRNDRLGQIMNNSSEDYLDFSKTQDIIFSQLPDNIKTELIKYIFSDTLYIYKNFFKAFSPIQYEICRFLQPRIFNPNEIIQKFNKPVQEILFKYSGVIEVSIVKKNESLGKVQLIKKCIIGDYYILKDINSAYQYKALNFVKGYSVPGYVMKKISESYYECSEEYIESIQSVYNELNDHMLEEMRKKSLDTKDTGDDKYVKEEMTGRENLIFLNGLLPAHQEICKLNMEVENVSKIVKNFNEGRKEILIELREKLANLAAVNLTKNKD